MPVIGVPVEVSTPPSGSTASSYSFADLRNRVSEYLGFGRDATALSVGDVAIVDDCITSGLNQFYYPPVPPAPSGWSWSFMKPVGRFSTNAQYYTLPVGYGGLVGPVTISTSSHGYETLQQVSEGMIREMYAKAPNATGRPSCCAIRAKSTDNSSIQLHDIWLFPNPNITYTFEYRYIMIPSVIQAVAPYPLGVPVHSEVILASCLAAAELHQNDEQGSRWEHFLRLLTAAINRDRVGGNSARNLGYNGDQSDVFGTERNRYSDIYVGGVNVTSSSSEDYGKLEVALSYVWGGRDGVIRVGTGDGMKVTATDPVSMIVDIAAGVGFVSNATLQIETGTTHTFSAPIIDNRIDLLQCGPYGVEAKTGVEASSPVAPTADTGYIPLAEVYLRPTMSCVKNTNDTVNGYITDKRTFL